MADNNKGGKKKKGKGDDNFFDVTNDETQPGTSADPRHLVEFLGGNEPGHRQPAIPEDRCEGVEDLYKTKQAENPHTTSDKALDKLGVDTTGKDVDVSPSKAEKNRNEKEKTKKRSKSMTTTTKVVDLRKKTNEEPPERWASKRNSFAPRTETPNHKDTASPHPGGAAPSQPPGAAPSQPPGAAPSQPPGAAPSQPPGAAPSQPPRAAPDTPADQPSTSSGIITTQPRALDAPTNQPSTFSSNLALRPLPSSSHPSGSASSPPMPDQASTSPGIMAKLCALCRDLKCTPPCPCKAKRRDSLTTTTTTGGGLSVVEDHEEGDERRGEEVGAGQRDGANQDDQAPPT